MTKKILFVAGHSRSTAKWAMVGEVLKRLLEDKENEIYILDCNNKIKGWCGLNRKNHIGYCNKCNKVCSKIAEVAGCNMNNILKMEKIKCPKFPNFTTIQDAINYEIEGYNLGLGPISCIMTLTRDYDFNIKKWDKDIKESFKTEYTTLKNIENFHNKIRFDEIHVFNGRMPSMYPAVVFAKKHDIPYYVYENGANINKFRTIKNNVTHDFYNWKKEVSEYWQNDDKNKIELANKWFKDRRAGKFQALASYTKDQIKDSLPKNWDETKENIVFFNSSIDEVYAFDSWKHPFAKDENEILKNLFEHYKNDETKHFYLRVHPNLTKAKKKKATQIREINEFKKLYKNLTVIEPDEKIDTYALMDCANKVLTTYSTMGCEATYWGNVSIIAGKAPYEDLDCVYKANSMEELYQLIDDKNLDPKPKESTYAYGYYNEVYGDDYKYYKAKSPSEGEFLGLKFSRK